MISRIIMFSLFFLGVSSMTIECTIYQLRVLSPKHCFLCFLLLVLRMLFAMNLDTINVSSL